LSAKHPTPHSQRYGHEAALPAGFDPADQALLTDPQTSGGLLVACAPDALDAVRATFTRHGFAQTAVVGHVAPQGDKALVVK
jgi:selenide,water dikinase